MSSPHGSGSAPERHLQETRDELAQASMALNTAYDRLQNLRASLRNFTAQRDRLSGVRRTNQQFRSQPQNAQHMGPDHTAIVLSESEEDTELDIDAFRNSLPSRLLELTTRWGLQQARLNAAARQMGVPESHIPPPSSIPSTLFSDEPRPALSASRRRRLPPPSGSSSRDATGLPVTASSIGAASPARRSILEAHMRHARHAAQPGESSTTLGRRVTQRAAAIANERQAAAAGSPAPPNTIIHSTLPLGLEPRPSSPPSGFVSTTPRIESRAATNLRHSLLPNPPSTRPSGSRPGSINATHTRLGDRTEHRPRTARSNSLTALSRTTSSPMQQTPNSADTVARAPPFFGRISPSSFARFPEEEDTARNADDPFSTSYRVRRHLNAQGEEQVFNISWSELMSEGDREEGISDLAVWVRPPQRSVPTFGTHSAQTQPEPDTDDTVVHDTPLLTREAREARPIGREGGARRRRGWGTSSHLRLYRTRYVHCS
ncbi:hypothetical protein K439DRAFT_621325 [Ramaria rubella]|nr:hypothetical protein K439DRAFT_621325 [Ramaria rubella]